MKRLLLTGIFAVTLGGVASAQPPPAVMGPGGAKYGAAGCGLGSIVFGAKPGFMQVFAATTNGSFGTQTFGITSGTSNCANTSAGAMTARAFVESNREAFAKDVSRGSGETIDTLATLSGCKDSRAVAVTLQKNFKSIFPSAKVSNTEVSSAAIASLKADKQLVCTQLI